MINITYVDTTTHTNLGVYTPSQAVALLGNLHYTPSFILIRESGITIIA
jgi:hypothetical protein